MMKYLPKLGWFKRNKRKSIVLLIIIIALLIIFRPKSPKPIPTEVIKSGTITQIVAASGTTYAATSVDLNFLAGGKLVYLGVKKGDSVKKGQVIASLDQRTAQTNLETALIAFNQQRNTYDQTIANNNGHTPSDALSDAMKRILQNNQYDLDKAVNSVELQSLAKEQSNLISPISGVLTRADVQTAGVNIGPTALFSVADTDSLIFKVDVDESDIGKIQEGQQMKISLDAYPEETISGTVESIDVASHATSTGGTAYTVQTTLSNYAATSYRIGMNGDAEITVGQRNNVLILPLSSLIDENHVYVQKGKLFERRQVKLGLQSDTEAEVASGLSKGDKVALIPDDVEKQFPKLKIQ